MKMYVMSANWYDGDTKKGRHMTGFFADCVYESGNGKKTITQFFNAGLLGGLVLEAGMVLDVSTNLRGFIESVKLVPDLECALVTRPSSKNAVGK